MSSKLDGNKTETKNTADFHSGSPQYSTLNFVVLAVVAVLVLFTLVMAFNQAPLHTNSNAPPEPRPAKP